MDKYKERFNRNFMQWAKDTIPFFVFFGLGVAFGIKCVALEEELLNKWDGYILGFGFFFSFFMFCFICGSILLVRSFFLLPILDAISLFKKYWPWSKTAKLKRKKNTEISVARLYNSLSDQSKQFANNYLDQLLKDQQDEETGGTHER